MRRQDWESETISMLLVSLIKSNCKEEIKAKHLVVKYEMNGCILFEKEKLNLEINKENFAEPDKSKSLVKIRVVRSYEFVKKELTKLIVVEDIPIECIEEIGKNKNVRDLSKINKRSMNMLKTETRMENN